MNKKEKQRGSVTLETALVLPMFLFLFLFLYGLFGTVSVHGQMTHALVQATKSLSMDSYLLENVDSAYESKTKFWSSLPDMVLDLVRLDTDPYFATTTDWYKTGAAEDVAKNRFIAYLAGGDRAAADKKLRDLNVVDGLSGVRFDVTADGQDVTVTIKYEIKGWFDFADTGTTPMEQTIKARMWKDWEAASEPSGGSSGSGSGGGFSGGGGGGGGSSSMGGH